MFVRHIKDCVEFVAGDASLLREILHPDKENLKIKYSLAYAKVTAGKTTRLHRLRTSEVYYILEGKGVMYINEQRFRVGVGYTVYIPPNSKQRIRNTGKTSLKFLCIVEPAWNCEDEAVLSD